MARFDLYKGKEYWWWVYFLSLAANKGKPEYELLSQLIYDAVDYADEKLTRKEALDKYNDKNGTFKTRI